MMIHTSIIFDQFQGGRFFSGRYVYSVEVRDPVIQEGWWNNRLDSDTYYKLLAFAKESGAETRPAIRGDRKRRRQVSAFQFEGDALTQTLFGITAAQFFNRRLKRLQIVAVERSRGWWYCEAELLPLMRVPRRQSACVGRIPKEYESLFASVFLEWENWEPGFKPNYDGLDFGPERKPPVWVCNLCGRTAEWKDWPKSDTAGIANSDYISMCPQCRTERGGLFKQVEVAMLDTKDAFRPTMRMQDELYFTI